MDKWEVLYPAAKDYPVIELNEDVRIEVYRSTIDNEYVVQISTSPETDSYEGLRVYLNEARVAAWR